MPTLVPPPPGKPHLDPSRKNLPFAPGEGPFQARGVVYVALLKYVQKHTPGGLGALRLQIDAADWKFLDRIFVSGQLYDIGPLVRAILVASSLEGADVEAFVKSRGRDSADMDIRGMYRLLLMVTSPRTMASRLPQAFDRYFVPARARLINVSDGSFAGEIEGFPWCLADWYRCATEGFVGRALEIAGATAPTFSWGKPAAAPAVREVPTARLSLSVVWR